MLSLLKGLKFAKTEALSNLLVEGDSMIVLFWINKERSSWRLDGWLHQIFYIALELGCSLWIPWPAKS